MYMIKFLHIVLTSLTISLATTKELSAEIVANWNFYDGTVALLSTTSPQNPDKGKTTGIFVAYDKSFFRCMPTVSLMSYNGLVLGRVTRPQKHVYKESKNRLVAHVNGKRFAATGATVVNEYSNGTEVVAMFDQDLIAALQNPGTVSLSIGNGQPIFSARAMNSISAHVMKAYKSCTG